MRPTFKELDIEPLRESTVILDVDGALVPDKKDEIQPVIRNKVRELASVAEVILCSNGAPERTSILAQQLGVRHASTRYSKPNPKIVAGIPMQYTRRVVLGDKVLMDGLLAFLLGYEFVHVAHERDGKENVFARFAYALDDTVAFGIAYAALARVRHWVKNLLLFAPLFFAGSFSFGALGSLMIAFFAFSFLTSAVYAFNDISDAEQDARHPFKKKRPIPSGAISVASAWVFSGILLAMSIALTSLVPNIAVPLGAYLLGNIAYTLYIKHIPFFDILLVALLYVLRVVAGGVAAAVVVSSWLMVCVFFGALFIIAGKRYAEYRHTAKRKVLQRYTPSTLKLLVIGSASAVLLLYCAYTFVRDISPYAPFSVLFVGVGIGRMTQYILRRHEHAESPEKLVWKDPVVVLSFVCWIVFMGALLYN